MPILESELELNEKLLGIIYPFLDFCLLMLALFVYIKIEELEVERRGAIHFVWLWLVLAVILMGVGDAFFVYMILNKAYYTGAVPDFFYLWSYGIFALSACSALKITEFVEKKKGREIGEIIKFFETLAGPVAIVLARRTAAELGIKITIVEGGKISGKFASEEEEERFRNALKKKYSEVIGAPLVDRIFGS